MNRLLLPYRWKWVGIVLTLAGIILSVLFFWFDFRFKIPVFALYSAFIETKVCAVIRTNVADEMILLLLISGLGLIILSKEKNEAEGLDLHRMKAMFRAVILNTVFLLVSVLFVYGSGFMAILVINTVSLFVIYLLLFYISKRVKTEL
jgi:hypothetical protein